MDVRFGGVKQIATNGKQCLFSKQRIKKKLLLEKHYF